jgi:hypothetical protein
MSIFYSGSLIVGPSGIIRTRFDVNILIVEQAGAFGNLIAGGILNGLDYELGMRAWQW